MSTETIEEGGCLCGRIRYRIAGAVDAAVHCHCRMCRRSSGGTVVTWVTAAAERFTITRGAPAVYRSSTGAERRFCPDCGAQLTFWSERCPDGVDVTLGTLDHPERHPADHHIWTSSRVPWLHLDEHLPGHAEFAPVDAYSQRQGSGTSPADAS